MAFIHGFVGFEYGGFIQNEQIHSNIVFYDEHVFRLKFLYYKSFGFLILVKLILHNEEQTIIEVICFRLVQSL